MKDVLNRDEVAEVLADEFYKRKATGKRPARRRRRKPKPDHYEVICISMYTEDLVRLDEKVAALKASGHRKMSRSALIRFALDTMDTKKLPKSY